MSDRVRIVRLSRQPTRPRRGHQVRPLSSGDPASAARGEHDMHLARERSRRRHPAGRDLRAESSAPPHLYQVNLPTCACCEGAGQPIVWSLPLEPPPVGVVVGGSRRPLLAPAWQCGECGFRWGDDGEQHETIAALMG